jgi:hypothetical protein
VGHAGAQLVDTLRYKQEGREFDSRWGHCTTMIDTFTKLKGEASNVGLTINKNKTKYLYCTRQASRNVPIFEGANIEQVNHFKYLASIVNNNNSIEDEIK